MSLKEMPGLGHSGTAEMCCSSTHASLACPPSTGGESSGASGARDPIETAVPSPPFLARPRQPCCTLPVPGEERERMYRRLLDRGWPAILLVFAVSLAFLGSFLPRVTVDASTNILLDEHDPDLTYYSRSRRLFPS